MLGETDLFHVFSHVPVPIVNLCFSPLNRQDEVPGKMVADENPVL